MFSDDEKQQMSSDILCLPSITVLTVDSAGAICWKFHELLSTADTEKIDMAALRKWHPWNYEIQIENTCD